jgi:hypothetical protein
MAYSVRTSFLKACRLDRHDWLYLSVAIKELAIARVRHATLPAGQIVRALERRDLTDVAGAPARGNLDIERLAWAIGAAAARVPWRADCLLAAMAADRWLRRHNRQPDFFLGASKDTAGKFSAHAWLHCDGMVVTGGSGAGYSRLIAPGYAPQPAKTSAAIAAERTDTPRSS